MFNILKTKKKQTLPTDEALDYNKLPVMTADELIQFTGQQTRILSIQRIINLDKERFQVLYLDVIYRFAELIQLMPASQAHHHAVPGGLLIHTLEVIEGAMRLRKEYKLPAFAEPEVQERERHAWTYAVFATAILHDIGKRVTLCNFITDKGVMYSAFEDQYLPQTRHKTYKIVFNSAKYHPLHEQIGLTFTDIFPEVGRKFIFSHLHILKEMCAYIHGDKFNAGMIGEIIRQADQKSTGESLAHSPTRKFKGANQENIGERLMTQLRLMIASNDFVINKPNANIYTSDSGYTYCVSKVIVDALREQLAKNNEMDIPADNNRIFDIFQEYGFVETNHYSGKSIHYIRIFHLGNNRVFTVLKFKTAKLFQVLPQEFEGKIEEVKDRTSENTAHIAADINHRTELPQSFPQDTETESASKTATASMTTPVATPEAQSTETTKVSTETETATHLETDIIDDLIADADGAGFHEPPFVTEASHESGATTAYKSVAEPVNTETVTDQKPIQPENQQIDLAADFLRWCREKLKEKVIVINESNGLIQKVSYGNTAVIAVVTPRIFSEYADSIGLPNPTEKSTFSKVQSAIHKSKLNIPAARGQIHPYKIKKSINNPLNGNIRISHYLFTIEVFCQNDEALMQIIKRIENNTNLVKV